MRVLGPVDARHLGVLRIAVFALWAGLIGTIDTDLFADLPPALIDPVGIGQFFPMEAIMSSSVLLLSLKILALLGCAACIVGARPFTPWAVPTVVLIVFHDAAMKSVGSYVNHAQMVLLFGAVLLALFPSADRLSIGRARERRSGWLYRVPFTSMAVVLVLLYSFIGARRLFVGGLTVFSDGTILTWATARTYEYSSFSLDFTEFMVGHAWVGTLLGLGMAITTLFEILSPLALRFARFNVVWVVVILGFHLGTLLTMNILFWENIVLIVVLFTPLTQRIVDRLSPPPAGESHRGRVWQPPIGRGRRIPVPRVSAMAESTRVSR